MALVAEENLLSRWILNEALAADLVQTLLIVLSTEAFSLLLLRLTATIF